LIAGPFGSSIKKEEYVEKGYKVYGQEQVIPDDLTIGDYYISEKKFQELKRFKIKHKDVLISCVGTFGKIAIVPENAEPGIINPRLIKLTPNSLICYSQFLSVYLKSYSSFLQLDKYSRGGTMDIINLTLLSKIFIVVPPTTEQFSIFEYILECKSKYSELIKKTEYQIRKLQEYQESLISDAVTGKIDVRNIN